MDKKYLIGFFVGFAFSLLFIPIPSGDAAIPPTSAFAKINVMTSPWFGEDTWVNATSSTQQIFYVSDGSITLNVTNFPPP